MEAFVRLIVLGKVPAIGTSDFVRWRLAEANGISARTEIPAFAAVQYRGSYLQPCPGADLGVQLVILDEPRDSCRERNVALLAYSPLPQGVDPNGVLVTTSRPDHLAGNIASLDPDMTDEQMRRLNGAGHTLARWLTVRRISPARQMGRITRAESGEARRSCHGRRGRARGPRGLWT